MTTTSIATNKTSLLDNTSNDDDVSSLQVLNTIVKSYQSELETNYSQKIVSLLSEAMSVRTLAMNGESENLDEKVFQVLSNYYQRKEPTIITNVIITDVVTAQNTLKRKRSTTQSEIRSVNSDHDAKKLKQTPQQEERSNKYIVITQNKGLHMLIVAVHARNKEFFENLFDRIGQLSSNLYTIGKHFIPSDVVSQFQNKIAPSLGYTGRVYHRLERKWSEKDWLESDRSVFDLLQKSETGGDPKDFYQNATENNTVMREIAAGKLCRLESLLQTYLQDFSLLLLWSGNLIDSFMVELEPRLTFTVFQHCYLNLVSLNGGDFAVKFYERFYKHFDIFDLNAELLSLRSIISKDLMEANDSIASMRGLGSFKGQKYLRTTFFVSKDCYDLLMHDMQMDMIPVSIRTVMRSFVNFVVREK